MEIVYFTAVAILLYLFADWLLRRIESHMGRALPQRSVIFFAILLALALISFSLIQRLAGP